MHTANTGALAYMSCYEQRSFDCHITSLHNDRQEAHCTCTGQKRLHCIGMRNAQWSRQGGVMRSAYAGASLHVLQTGDRLY